MTQQNCGGVGGSGATQHNTLRAYAGGGHMPPSGWPSTTPAPQRRGGAGPAHARAALRARRCRGPRYRRVGGHTGTRGALGGQRECGRRAAATGANASRLRRGRRRAQPGGIHLSAGHTIRVGGDMRQRTLAYMRIRERSHGKYVGVRRGIQQRGSATRWAERTANRQRGQRGRERGGGGAGV